MAVEKSGIAKDVTEVSFCTLITFSEFLKLCCSPISVFLTRIHTDAYCLFYVADWQNPNSISE